jgi:hypothetical protein
VPKPVFLESKTGGSNWRLAATAECSGLCHTILADVATQLADKYELKA